MYSWSHAWSFQWVAGGYDLRFWSGIGISSRGSGSPAFTCTSMSFGLGQVPDGGSLLLVMSLLSLPGVVVTVIPGCPLGDYISQAGPCTPLGSQSPSGSPCSDTHTLLRFERRASAPLPPPPVGLSGGVSGLGARPAERHNLTAYPVA